MDLTIILIVCVILLAVAFCLCLAIANFAPERFWEIYNQVDKEESYTDVSPLQMVTMFNRDEFKNKLRLHEVEKQGEDGYLRGGDLILSTHTLNSTGIASYATIAHELGHSLQDRDSNKLRVRIALLRINKIIGPFLFPYLIAGTILAVLGANLFVWGIALISAGIVIFLLSLILKLFTISIEKDASKKAIAILQKYLNWDKNQLKLAKKLLNSAKLTYWGSFFQTLLGWTFLTKNKKYYR